jgi:heme-degrading monooxygenase HmoA
MYLTLMELTTTPATRRAFLEREGSYHELLARQPGLRAVLTVRSLGNPGTYLRGSVWDDLEAADAFIGGAAEEAWHAANPFNNLGTLARPVEAYDLALEVGQAVDAIAPGMTVVLLRWTLVIKQGFAQAFEESRKAIFELRQQHIQGFVRSSLYRFLGTPDRYLVVNTIANRAASLADLDSVPLQEFMTTHPPSAYTTTPLEINTYEVVRVTRHA